MHLLFRASWSYGKEKYYPTDEQTKNLLDCFKVKCVSLNGLKGLKALGFTITFKNPEV